MLNWEAYDSTRSPIFPTGWGSTDIGPGVCATRQRSSNRRLRSLWGSKRRRANSTNYYGGGGDPCAFTYNVPAERLNQLLNEVNYCAMYSRTQVNCSRELTRDYGQIRLDRRDGAGAGGGKNPGSSAELSNPTVPASALSPVQRAEAERLWQRSVTLIDRNNYREAIPLLLQAGRLGHAKAQATLGIAYQDGNGVRRDDAAAAHWFQLAVAQGHRAAQYALAGMLEEFLLDRLGVDSFCREVMPSISQDAHQFGGECFV